MDQEAPESVDHETSSEPAEFKLPEEILLETLSYVDFKSRREASLVCRSFYELICFLEKDLVPLNLNDSQLYEDDETFDSIINTKREFNELTINLKGNRVLPSSGQIEKVLKKFGPRLKKFKLWGAVQFETSEVSEKQLMTMLGSLPNVEVIIFRNIRVVSSFLESHDLDLFNLRRIVIDYCLFETAALLNSIPRDVLSELVFTFEPLDETRFQNFFNRQTRIKKLELFENDQINFDHLQLEHLKISSSIDFAQMIAKQPNLQYLDFAITWIDDKVFAAVCQLKHLKTLKTLIDQVSIREFQALKNLELKELRLDSHCSYDTGHLLELSLMRCPDLEKLTLMYTERMIPAEILIQISQNFRSLRNMEFVNRSIKIIAVCLEHFPLVESLLFDFFAIFGAPEDILIISDELVHENLKQLVITNVNINEVENSIAIKKLMNACKNLERIMLSQVAGFSFDDFKEILEHHSNLTHLSIEFYSFELTAEVVEVIRNAKKIVHLRLAGLDVYPRYSTLRNVFVEHFPNITLYEYANKEGELIMKKRNTPDWYLNFKLMDHF